MSRLSILWIYPTWLLGPSFCLANRHCDLEPNFYTFPNICVTKLDVIFIDFVFQANSAILLRCLSSWSTWRGSVWPWVPHHPSWHGPTTGDHDHHVMVIISRLSYHDYHIMIIMGATPSYLTWCNDRWSWLSYHYYHIMVIISWLSWVPHHPTWHGPTTGWGWSDYQ